MKSRLMLIVAFVGLVPAGNAAGEYDFFAGAVYPGPVQKPGIDLYKVKQTGGTDPKAYERREVVWWPRKGVDIIPVQSGMIERTWTLRDRKMDPAATAVNVKLGIDELTRRLTWKQPRKFTCPPE